MIETFGKKLVEDLYDLQANMEKGFPFSRNRSDSTGSNPLSIHSLLSNPGSGPDVLSDAQRTAEDRKAAEAEANRAVEAGPSYPSSL